MPGLAELTASLRDTTDVQFIGIALEKTATVEEFKKFIQDNGIATWRHAYSTDKAVKGGWIDRYAVEFVPTTVLIDRDGVIRGGGVESTITAEQVRGLMPAK